jgi:malate dehydrogenase (oxaloacetate-decarboxylating)(NADP+)
MNAPRGAHDEENEMTDPFAGRAPAGAPAWLPRGVALLREPTLNKGTAFTDAERDALGLRGLLPPHVLSQEEQEARILENFRRKPSDLEKYIDLNALHDRNEALFFRIVINHPDEMLPIIYTPTVGLACQQFGHIFQRPRGLFIGAHDRGRIANLLRNWPYHDVRMIVVTDGERILGLGDLGACGMGIPVGKLALYTAGAGVHPTHCLPVILDVGTNNEALRNDPLYVGLKQPRLSGGAYDELVEEFIAATQEVFPGVVVQFEDFANHNAFRLLEKYRNRICTFNDDIQGTAAVALAGILSALRVTGGALPAQKLLFFGAGEAATGIADLVVEAMVAAGVDKALARSRCWLVDSQGLVVKSRAKLATHKLPYAHEHAPTGDFLAAIRALKPTAIIGVAAVGGTFTREVIEEMGRVNQRPIVFALSNPTSKSECTAQQAYEWSGGRALFASGSPFDPVTLGGRTYVSRQGNNSYIFPGVGLGSIVSRTRRITDAMFLAAAQTLAAQVTEADLAQGSLYPPLAKIREVSAHIAAAVAAVAFRHDLAGITAPPDLLAYVRAQMYDPQYVDYVAPR